MLIFTNNSNIKKKTIIAANSNKRRLKFCMTTIVLYYINLIKFSVLLLLTERRQKTNLHYYKNRWLITILNIYVGRRWVKRTVKLYASVWYTQSFSNSYVHNIYIYIIHKIIILKCSVWFYLYENI